MTMRVREESVRLEPTAAQSIKDHAVKESAKGKYEAVGFMLKRAGGNVGVATLPLHNHASNPHEAFFVEPWEQYRAEQRAERGGYEILGVYHSHPNSEALPSQMDHTLARPGEYVFIYSVVFDDLKAYKTVDNILEPVDLLI